MAMSQEEIFEKVQEVLVDALGVDDDEVVANAKLGADLGAESIDYLDISFRLEKIFEITIEQGEMLPDEVLSDAQYVVDGKVNDAGIAELTKRMPHADLTSFEAGDRSVEQFSDVFTVDAVVKFVSSKLA